MTGKYLSEKLKEYKYLINCLIEEGAFPEEVKVMFPCYDKNNALGVNVICCHPCHVDIGNGFCRADLKKREGNKGILNMNGERFVVSLDSLVENLQPNP